ncbi:MAG: hypothetical protein ACFFDI_06120 [Promethearchaeota archaeon]
MQKLMIVRKIGTYFGVIGLFWATLFLILIVTHGTAAAFPVGIDKIELFINDTDLVNNSMVSFQADETVDFTINITTQEGFTFILREVTFTMGELHSFSLSESHPEIKNLIVPSGSSGGITISFALIDYTSDALKPLVSSLRGTVEVIIKLDYEINGNPTEWTNNNLINWPAESIGRAIANPVGLAATGATVLAAGTGATMVISVLGFGMVERVAATETLKQLLEGLLPKQVEGQITRKLLTAAANLVSRKKCPICNNRFKRSICNTCNLTYIQVRKKYAQDVKHWAEQMMSIMEKKSRKKEFEIPKIQTIANKLKITKKQATDVYLAMTKANLFYSSITKKLGKKVVIFGFTSGISIILWSAVGGILPISFKSVPLAIGIIIGLTIVPIVVMRLFERSRRKKLAKLV